GWRDKEEGCRPVALDHWLCSIQCPTTRPNVVDLFGKFLQLFDQGLSGGSSGNQALTRDTTQSLSSLAEIFEKLGICSKLRFLQLLQNGVRVKRDARLVVTDLYLGTTPVRLFQPKAASSSPRRGIIFFPGGGGFLGSLGKDVSSVRTSARPSHENLCGVTQRRQRSQVSRGAQTKGFGVMSVSRGCAGRACQESFPRHPLPPCLCPTRPPLLPGSAPPHPRPGSSGPRRRPWQPQQPSAPATAQATPHLVEAFRELKPGPAARCQGPLDARRVAAGARPWSPNGAGHLPSVPGRPVLPAARLAAFRLLPAPPRQLSVGLPLFLKCPPV
uniref:Uncharacterized protein n=1 Tax=Canis lupus familiaris TaxID=9615 RepID=A0A8C0MK76_CANLF